MESTTGDFLEYHEKGIYNIFGVETYYNKDMAANILAFHTLNALPNAYMHYDGRVADCCRLIYNDGKEIQFCNYGKGLYEYVDPKYKCIATEQSFVQYLQTVYNNEKLFSKREIDRAKYAVEVQEFLAWLSTQDFLSIEAGNHLKNCDLTVDNVTRSIILYGEPVPYLQGRMTRSKPIRDDPLSRLQLTLPHKLHEKRIELYIDIFHFMGCQFLLQESSIIKYVDVDDVFNQKIENLIRLIIKVITKYKKSGLQVSGVHVDNQFCNDAFENALKPAILIPYTVREHVSIAKQRNRLVKERMQSLIAGTPFQIIPKVMVRGAAKKAVQMLNRFPAKDGVSTYLSQAEIVDGKHKYGHETQTHCLWSICTSAYWNR